MSTKASIKCTKNKYEELCKLLHEAIYGNQCVLCPNPRYRTTRFCKPCYNLCPKQKATYDEVTVKVKIRKDKQ